MEIGSAMGRAVRCACALALVLACRSGAEARVTSRAHGTRVRVDAHAIRIMDGDTAEITWSPAERETVRVLGIDAPELFERGSGRDTRTIPGFEARGFARGAFATAREITLLRATMMDGYGRTLGYFFLDGRNYSVLALESGMARETISRFGDNGFPEEAARVMEAARSRRFRRR